MRLSEVQKQNLRIEYLLLVNKILELESRCDELEDEQEKDILTCLFERYYWKIYTMKADYDI
jgi:hypothetical protein